MPIQPKPFTLKCSACNWSEVIQPKSDQVDESWGLHYHKMGCPKCGGKIERTVTKDLLWKQGKS